MGKLEDKIPKKAEVLVQCNYRKCKERGEYIRCYFDIYDICPAYLAHKRYLKRIERFK